MGKPIEFPKDGRADNYYALYDIEEGDDDTIIVQNGWIFAPHRGSEIMNQIQDELQAMSQIQQKVVIHRFEASNLKGRQLISKFPDYQFVGRSSTHDPIYEKKYYP